MKFSCNLIHIYYFVWRYLTDINTQNNSYKPFSYSQNVHLTQYYIEVKRRSNPLPSDKLPMLLLEWTQYALSCVLFIHQFPLLDAYPMFACEAPAKLNAKLQNLNMTETAHGDFDQNKKLG